jgi:ribosomal protein L2
LYKYFIIKPSLVPIIVYGFGFKKNPLKEFVWGKNLYNQIFFFLHVNYMYPGFKVLNYLSFFNKMKTPCNQIFPIYLLPINSIICFIFNKNNQYMTFSKSSGCNATKKKTHKKYKLIYIELPSLKIITVKYDIYCVYSNNKNNFLNKVVEGGWGFSHKNKKLVSVRGVAKNPVDHPNGGRTKAKQPELSP